MADILTQIKLFFCPKLQNKIKLKGVLNKLMLENQIKAQNQIARIANHNIVENRAKIVSEELGVYEMKFNALKPSMCELTLQEII